MNIDLAMKVLYSSICQSHLCVVILLTQTEYMHTFLNGIFILWVL